MFQAKSKRKGKPKPSVSGDSEKDDISILEAIEEGSYSAENPSGQNCYVKKSEKSKSGSKKIKEEVKKVVIVIIT